MYIISTSKKTVLSDFENLETKSTYAHANEEATDFQFNAQRRVFVEVNKKAGLAVMRIKEKQQNAPELQRVRKLTIENAYSVGCAKSASNQIAIGQSSGCVKLFNFSSAQLIHRYPADHLSSTVLYVDYNCTDDYIAAVLDGGRINIYGTKIMQKIQTICNDDNPTLARYHPKNRFQLGVASERGTVSVYDVQMNRSIFYVENAHDAPCRDVSMCSVQPWMLVSVGYDSRINIFDIRRNTAQTPCDRLVCKHPMSTVALSECGIYICAGNLKGELITYDARHTKSPLTTCSVHDGCAVTRCAFVPKQSEEQQTSSFSSSNNTAINVSSGMTVGSKPMPSNELRKSVTASMVMTRQQYNSYCNNKQTPAPVRQTRDSFCDFLDGERVRGGEHMSIKQESAYFRTLDSKTEETQKIDQNTNENRMENPFKEFAAAVSQSQQLPCKETNGLPDEKPNAVDLVDKWFDKLEPDLKWSSERIKFTILQYTERYCNRQEKLLDETYDAIHRLLTRDEFIIEFCNMQAQNRMLKEKLKQLLNEQEQKEQTSTGALSPK